MTELSRRLREPAFIVVLAVALAGWLAFLAMWINSTNQNGQLQQQVALVSEERDTSRNQLAEREAASGSLADTQTQLVAKQEELTGVNTTLETAQADLDARTKELTELAANIEARRTELTTLEQGVSEATASTKQLADDKTAIEGDIETTTQQLNDVGARLEAARQQEETATANIAKLAEEAATATASLAQTQSQLQKARTDLTAAQEQLTGLAARQEEAGAQVTALETEASELEKRRTALETEVADYQGQRDALQPQVAELTRTLADRSAELQTLEGDIAAARTVGTEERYVGNGSGVALTLGADGTFTMENVGRRVTGDFTRTPTQLIFTDGTGDIRGASFPMTCPISESGNGFAIGQAAGCPLAGLEFERE